MYKRIQTNIERRTLMRELSEPRPVASGRGYCLQTAHLESQRWGHFVRNSAHRPNYGVLEGLQPSMLRAHTTLALPLSLNFHSHQAMLHRGSRILGKKSRLVAPFYDKYTYIWFYLVLRTVTHYAYIDGLYNRGSYKACPSKNPYFRGQEARSRVLTESQRSVSGYQP